MKIRHYKIAHWFCGAGGSGIGTSAASARHGDAEARFECIGGIDFDARACRDFERLVKAPSLCADFHQLQPADVVRFHGDHAPDAIMMSPPCKGFSGLLSAKRAAEDKYQLMNQLMVRAIFLATSSWDPPPPLIFVENVPRIASRGRDIVHQVVSTLEAAGYAVTVGTHDCGELGGLAQHRRRWFLLARLRSRVPNFIYQPPKLPVRACGAVIGPMPMPGDELLGGPMHSIPNLSWKNWVRLSLIPAGGDWRDLPGVLAEGQARREVFRRDPVTAWDAAAETVTGPGGSASTNIADPRIALSDNEGRHTNKYAVTDWATPAKTVTGTDTRVGSGAPSVADPRIAATVALPASATRHNNKFTVHGWADTAPTVTGAPRPDGGAPSVADPRWGGGRLGVNEWAAPVGAVAGESLPNNGKYAVSDPRFTDGKKRNWQQVAGVTPWTVPFPTVTSSATIHAGPFQVADPRLTCSPRAGAYRVLGWQEAAATISGSLSVDNGAAAVADPRITLDSQGRPTFTPIIVAADGTWHRPITTYELAMLQSFPSHVDGEPLVLDGDSHTRWREAIGNAVPPDAAENIADQLLSALLLAELGSWELSSNAIWVAPQMGALVA